MVGVRAWGHLIWITEQDWWKLQVFPAALQLLIEPLTSVLRRFLWRFLWRWPRWPRCVSGAVSHRCWSSRGWKLRTKLRPDLEERWAQDQSPAAGPHLDPVRFRNVKSTCRLLWFYFLHTRTEDFSMIWQISSFQRLFTVNGFNFLWRVFLMFGPLWSCSVFDVTCAPVLLKHAWH